VYTYIYTHIYIYIWASLIVGKCSATEPHPV
jgi:hypothetical protein